MSSLRYRYTSSKYEFIATHRRGCDGNDSHLQLHLLSQFVTLGLCFGFHAQEADTVSAPLSWNGCTMVALAHMCCAIAASVLQQWGGRRHSSIMNNELGFRRALPACQFKYDLGVLCLVCGLALTVLRSRSWNSSLFELTAACGCCLSISPAPKPDVVGGHVVYSQ